MARNTVEQRAPLLCDDIDGEVLQAMLTSGMPSRLSGQHDVAKCRSGREQDRRRGTIRPVRPSRTMSTIPSTAVATAGTARKPASMSTAGMLSPPLLVRTRTSAAA